LKHHAIEVVKRLTLGSQAGLASACSIMSFHSRANSCGEDAARSPSVNQPQKNRSTHGGRVTPVENRLPQGPRVFGSGQAGNGASDDPENPIVEFVGKAVDLLLSRLVDLRD
jgi:hypothetical protein